MATDRIKIFDTTLRDGEQAPGCSMTLREKLRIARALSDLNVDIIEAGFPAASPGDFEAVKAIADENRGPRVTEFLHQISDDPENQGDANIKKRLLHGESTRENNDEEYRY